MPIDPVIVLVERLRSVDSALVEAHTNHRRDRSNGKQVHALLMATRALNSDLLETCPTSVLGAAELIHLMVKCIPSSHAQHADRFRAVAERLGSGQRRLSDLIWLRAMALEFKQSGDKPGRRARRLLHLAVLGVARPTVIARGYGSRLRGSGPSSADVTSQI